MHICTNYLYYACISVYHGIMSTRDTKSKVLANQGNVKKINDHSFKAKSQSGSKIYEVKTTPNGMTCTCPDFIYRGGKTRRFLDSIKPGVKARGPKHTPSL